MYFEHFGLLEKPFNILPDPDFLYFSPSHRQALAILEYGVFEQTGITVISGEVGCGKTTLLRHLIRRIPSDEVSLAMLANVHQSLGSLMKLIAVTLGLPDADQQTDNAMLLRMLQDYVVQEYAGGRRVVLIVDEAQNMSMEALEELRMLTNMNADKDQLLQIVLVGQPELLDVLTLPSMAQIAQRVTAEYHLKALNRQETIEYIRERLRIAGAGHREIFSIDAIDLIYCSSGGIPRLINALCDQCLVLAYGANSKRVELNTTLVVIHSKRIGGVNRTGARPDDAQRALDRLKRDTGIDVEGALSLSR